MQLQLLLHLLHLFLIVIVINVVVVFYYRSWKAMDNVFEGAGDTLVKYKHNNVVCISNGGDVVDIIVIVSKSSNNDSYNQDKL